MPKKSGYFAASVLLLFTGGVLFGIGLPYTIAHFGEPPLPYCCGVNTVGTTPSIDLILRNNDTFQYFFVFGLISLALGGYVLLYIKWKKEGGS